MQDTYSLHGLTLSVAGDSGAAEFLRARLRHFPPAGHVDHPDFSLEFLGIGCPEEHPIARPRGQGRPVYDYVPWGEVLYFEGADQLYLDFDPRIRVLAGLSNGTASVSFLGSDPRNSFLAAHSYFTVLLMEWAKSRGRYPLHAATVCIGDRALVLPGRSGAGKTTLVLALLRAGFDLLGDDIAFFTVVENGLQVFGFADTAGITDDTLKLFPEAAAHFCPSAPLGLRKQLIWIENVYGSSVRARSQPAAVIFPRVAHADKSELTPMGQEEAFLALLGQLRPTQVRSSQAHLELLAHLVTVCPCFRLETGHDLEVVSSLLRPLLE